MMGYFVIAVCTIVSFAAGMMMHSLANANRISELEDMIAASVPLDRIYYHLNSMLMPDTNLSKKQAREVRSWNGKINCLKSLLKDEAGRTIQKEKEELGE